MTIAIVIAVLAFLAVVVGIPNWRARRRDRFSSWLSWCIAELSFWIGAKAASFRRLGARDSSLTIRVCGRSPHGLGCQAFSQAVGEHGMRSQLDPMKKFLKILRKHQDHVAAFIETEGMTNAISEGINRIVKIVKNRASGFRTLDAFSDLIFLTVGDVDIPDQIPTKFRTV